MISLYVDTLMRIFRVMFAPRSNYIHLMCEFVLVPIHCPLFWDFTTRDMCVKRFTKLVISRVITYNGTSPPKVVHKSRKWTIAHSNVRKRIFWVLRQWKREMICLRKFIVSACFVGHICRALESDDYITLDDTLQTSHLSQSRVLIFIIHCEIVRWPPCNRQQLDD